ncbi:MAG: hypothetical protein A2X56_12930 [Nitrospirae bacterium GWC2_57_13]|nr:MAG: hypothetical protein A2X56_12930 [Nitrospirae bacterium GWC2_57_13]OGW42771.1 MAG: hypothetical protein A2X57_01820 [Nitrospirae bacterium GWD2_57_8]HAS52893.1 hypothetical protein [Nitrospiraceae bacterium]
MMVFINSTMLHKAACLFAFSILTVLLFVPCTAPAQQSYNKLIAAGAAELQKGEYGAARSAFEEAVRLKGDDPAGRFGLGLAYFHLREDRLAEQELSRVIELNPRETTAFQVLGELSYRNDDLERAAGYWEKAVELNPGDEKLRARLDRIRKEHRAEKDFNRDVTSHFLVKYEGREKIAAGRIILRILEDAYSAVGRELSYYPSREVQVILYSDQQFRDVTDAPGWSGGIFDGKIRIPIAGIEQETPGLRRLLYHEYTHAAVRSITPRVPAWLNEGLAQYFEGPEITAAQQEALRRIARDGKLPRLSALEGSFMGLGGSDAAYAYLFSLSAVRHMVDRYGMYRVKAVLDELAAGADTGRSLDRGLLLSYEDFERGWKRSLE